MDTDLDTSFQARWDRAATDTEFASRDILVGIAQAVVVYLVLRRLWSASEAMQEVVAIAVAVVVSAVLLPVGKFVWNFYNAPFRIAADEITKLRSENSELRQRVGESREHPAKQWILEAIREGNSLLRELAALSSGPFRIPMRPPRAIVKWQNDTYKRLTEELPEYAAKFFVADQADTALGPSSDRQVENMKRRIDGLAEILREIESR